MKHRTKAIPNSCLHLVTELLGLGLVEENRQMKTALSVLVDDNRIMRSEVSSLQKCLEYRKPESTHHCEVSESLMTTRKEIPPRRSALPIVNPTQISKAHSRGRPLFRTGEENNKLPARPNNSNLPCLLTWV